MLTKSTLVIAHRFLDHDSPDVQKNVGKDFALRAAKLKDGKCIEYRELLKANSDRIGDFLELEPKPFKGWDKGWDKAGDLFGKGKCDRSVRKLSTKSQASQILRELSNGTLGKNLESFQSNSAKKCFWNKGKR